MEPEKEAKNRCLSESAILEIWDLKGMGDGFSQVKSVFVVDIEEIFKIIEI